MLLTPLFSLDGISNFGLIWIQYNPEEIQGDGSAAGI
jgi:hypothetical protein